MSEKSATAGTIGIWVGNFIEVVPGLQNNVTLSNRNSSLVILNSMSLSTN